MAQLENNNEQTAPHSPALHHMTRHIKDTRGPILRASIDEALPINGWAHKTLHITNINKQQTQIVTFQFISIYIPLPIICFGTAL